MSDQEAQGGHEVPIEKLAILNWLGEVGVEGVEDRLRNLHANGIAVRREQTQCGYAAPGAIERQFEPGTRIGVKALLQGAPEGSALVLFSPKSANNAAALMLYNAVDDLSTVPEDMARDALTELGNMIVNGFLDEWADLFKQEIGSGPPIPVQHTEQAIVRNLTESNEDSGLYISARLRLPEYDADAEVYVFPNESEFVGALSKLQLHHIGAESR